MSVIDYGGPDSTGIVLLHGLMGRAFTWADTASWLVRHGRVVAFDAQGHGGVPYGERDTRVEDAIRVITEHGLAPAVLIGHSMGGITAWQVAARRPDLVRAIVLGDIGPRVEGGDNAAWRNWFDSWPLPFASRQAAAVYFGRQFPGEGRFLAEIMQPAEEGFVPHFTFDDMLALRASWDAVDLSAELEAVTCPVLLVKGELSAYARADLEQVAARLPHGAYAEVADAGHVLHYDNPAGWRRVVEPFVEKLIH